MKNETIEVTIIEEDSEKEGNARYSKEKVELTKKDPEYINTGDLKKLIKSGAITDEGLNAESNEALDNLFDAVLIDYDKSLTDKIAWKDSSELLQYATECLGFEAEESENFTQ